MSPTGSARLHGSSIAAHITKGHACNYRSLNLPDGKIGIALASHIWINHAKKR